MIPCPMCGHEQSSVVDTRSNTKDSSIRRRRKCDACGEKYTTRELMGYTVKKLQRAAKAASEAIVDLGKALKKFEDIDD